MLSAGLVNSAVWTAEEADPARAATASVTSVSARTGTTAIWASPAGALRRVVVIVLRTVIRGFLRNRDVMRMALPNTG